MGQFQTRCSVFFSLPMYCVSPLGLLEFLHPEYKGSDNSIHLRCHWSRCLERFFLKNEKKKEKGKKHSGTVKRRYSFNIEHTISFQVFHKIVHEALSYECTRPEATSA